MKALLSSVALLAVVSAGVLEAKDRDENRRAVPRAEASRKGGDSYFHRHGYTRLDIPKGHYPPPGECRIWYPGRPPGHQPPPGECRRLRNAVPRGAWLITHPHDVEDRVHVIVYDEQRPGSILAIGEFRIGTGVFVRVVVDR